MSTSVGVDIGGTTMVMVARRGDRLVDTRELATGPATGGRELERRVADFCAALGEPPDVVAIAVPGLVADDDRVVVSDVLPGITGWRPFDGVEAPPVFVINDVRASLACAVAGGPRRNVLSVVVGTAVGAAFTGDRSGDVVTGADGWAGELGYLPLRGPSGEWCRLDDLAGGAAIVRRLGRDGAEIHRLVAAGDPAALGAVVAAGEALGAGLAAAVNLLNPGVVFLGGGTLRFPGYVDAALGTAQVLALPESWASVSVARFPDQRRFIADGAVLACRGSRPEDHPVDQAADDPEQRAVSDQ